MMTAKLIPKKFSKKTRKGWRKVDIRDVEAVLEDERLQERTGGLAAYKTDDQLFFLDKKDGTPSTSNKSKTDTEPPLPRRRSDRARRPLKSHAIFDVAKHIKPVHKAYIKTAVTKPPPSAADRRISRAKLRAEVQKKDAVVDRRKRRSIHPEDTDITTYDLWNTDNKISEAHFETVTKKRRVNVPSRYREKASHISAVETPHPGSSYNPAFAEHQELLRTAVSKEVDEVEKEDKAVRELQPNYGPEGPPTEASWVKEMSQGLDIQEDNDSGSDDSNAEADINTNIDRISVNPPVRNKLKTRTQRNKQKRVKKEDELRKKKKETNMLFEEYKQIKSLNKKVRIQLEERAEKIVEREQKKDEFEKFGTKRLGKKKYQDAEVSVALSSDLSRSLRSAKPIGSLMDERFRSLQKRNLIEPRERAKGKRKYKLHYKEKRSHKAIETALIKGKVK